MKVPCDGCMCMPICRHKNYLILTNCDMVKNYLLRPTDARKRDKKRLIHLSNTIKPTRWRLVVKFGNTWTEESRALLVENEGFSFDGPKVIIDKLTTFEQAVKEFDRRYKYLEDKTTFIQEDERL